MGLLDQILSRFFHLLLIHNAEGNKVEPSKLYLIRPRASAEKEKEI